MEEEDQLKWAEVSLGIQASEFLNGPLGSYLLGRANEQLRVARDKLETCAAAQLEECQADAAVARSFISWMDELVQNGLIAEEQLQNEDYEE